METSNQALLLGLTSELCDVAAWSRGTAPVVARSSIRPAVIRLSIDSRGIMKVERLLSRPQYQTGRSDKMAFVIEEASHLEGVVAYFKVANVFNITSTDPNTFTVQRSSPCAA
jgi:hypothetical protein